MSICLEWVSKPERCKFCASNWMRMVQNGHGGRSIAKGHRFMFGVIVTVVFLICFQLWASHDNRMSTDVDKKVFQGRLLPLYSNSRGMKNNHNDSPEADRLRDVLQAWELCSMDAVRVQSGEQDRDKIRNEECFVNLLLNYTSVQQELLPLHPPPSGDSDTSRQLEATTDEKEEDGRLNEREVLKNQVASLGEMLKNSTVFLELQDTREPALTETDSNWFMSSIHGTQKADGFSEEFEFPSEISHGRILCFAGADQLDGTQNKYGFAWKDYLPPGSILLPGLTLVADNYWDYENIWHSMSALVNFVAWRGRNGCVVPERVLLYHWGQLVPSMSSWTDNVLHASFGRKVLVEQLEHWDNNSGPVCLERAVVNRRGLGGVSVPNLNILFDTIRCRARNYCEIQVPPAKKNTTTNITLLVRTGPRAFNNISDMTQVLRGVCEKFDGCHLEVAYVSGLSFCEQVALMGRTDVLITAHGAQMTNSIFMSKGGSVMELIPKGWSEFAGVGQHIYKWLADWSNLHHEGVWHDPEGPDCPYPTEETLKCFLFHKDLNIGMNETHLATWTEKVVGDYLIRKKTTGDLTSAPGGGCTCDS